MKRLLIFWGGMAVICAALYFLGRNLWAVRGDLLDFRPDAAMIVRLCVLSAVYGAAFLFMAECWHRIIALFGAEPRWRTFPSYTKSMIAKYIPGNVMHLVGRAACLRGGAVGDGDLARATGLELLIAPVGAAAAALLVLPFLPGDALARLVPIAPAGLAAAGYGAILAVWLVGPLRRVLRPLVVPALFATLFMLCLALVFAGVAGLVAEVPFAIAMITGLVSWLAGYATPGAPGGLGPREAVVAALLATTVPMDAALLIALLFRLVTICGDFMCFAAGFPIGKALRPQPLEGRLQPGH